MSRITDIQNPHEHAKTYISDSFYYANLTEFARTHMSNVCITKGKQIISKHKEFRFYLYPALIKGEQ
jgi:hypothetical protein